MKTKKYKNLAYYYVNDVTKPEYVEVYDNKERLVSRRFPIMKAIMYGLREYRFSLGLFG